ncbi:hypothetical protein ACLKAH_005323, partial [Escherichia coli]
KRPRSCAASSPSGIIHKENNGFLTFFVLFLAARASRRGLFFLACKKAPAMRGLRVLPGFS